MVVVPIRPGLQVAPDAELLPGSIVTVLVLHERDGRAALDERYGDALGPGCWVPFLSVAYTLFPAGGDVVSSWLLVLTHELRPRHLHLVDPRP